MRNIGDQVIILESLSDYERNVVFPMLQYKGKVGTIVSIEMVIENYGPNDSRHIDAYRIDIDNKDYFWTEAMLEPIHRISPDDFYNSIIKEK